ncbi:MAG: ATP-binding cassette domain-containing protein [Enterococcus sp.]|jgi:ABC-2 type transport system ATP-binding protein|nr:ATP-binding cassette domain-containing protein [Enterococcus sp.]
MIHLKNVSKTYRVPIRKAGFKQAVAAFFKREYRQIDALKKISLQIETGEMVGYIGPNGAGKSTTIKILSGILAPDEGKITIAGLDPFTQRKQHAKNIGVVFGQRTQLWWDLPVGDSFELLKEIYKIPADQYEQRLSEFIQLFELEDIIQRPVRQLSLGQRVRCDIAAALLHQPKVLFLDEPTIGLDAYSKQKVRAFIKQINQKYQVTVILTTHDMQDIEQIVSRVVLIGHGELLYDGKLDALVGKYGGTQRIQLQFQGELLSHASYTILEVTHRTAFLQINTNLADVIRTLQQTIIIDHLEVFKPTIDDVILNLYQEYRV